MVRLNRIEIKPSRYLPGIRIDTLSINHGDAFFMVSDRPDTSSLVFRILATLAYPEKGDFWFEGKKIDFTDYKNLLPIKRKIAYIAPDAALVSHLSLRDNLAIAMYQAKKNICNPCNDPKVSSLCRLFHLGRHLDEPAYLAPPHVYGAAIFVKELAKNPILLLLDFPETFISPSDIEIVYSQIAKRLSTRETAAVICSNREEFIELCNSGKLKIEEGCLSLA